MFAGLPNTPDVQKAKSELWQMMDDKYSELIAEGKAENEAIGIVISEFGNLEEIADSLGIRGYMAGGVRPSQGRMLNLAEAKKYISDRSSRFHDRPRHPFVHHKPRRLYPRDSSELLRKRSK